MATKPKPPAVKRPRNITRAKVGVSAAEGADTKSKALQMLLAGHRPPAIGEALGITRQGAWKAARAALEELKTETLDDAATWRALLTAEHMEQLVKGKLQRDGSDPKGSENGFAVVDKALTQLRGLWVPLLPTTSKQELTGKDGGPVQSAVGVTGMDLGNVGTEELTQLAALLAKMQGAGGQDTGNEG